MEVALVDSGGDRVSSDFRFASAVAMFGQLLRNSDFRGKATYDDVIALAAGDSTTIRRGYRREFIRLVETVKTCNVRNREYKTGRRETSAFPFRIQDMVV